MKLVVVSNSPKCLQYEAGVLIDSFDTVVRINNYVTEGFERYVGSKTTIWVHNNHPKDFKPRNTDAIQSIIVMGLWPPSPQNQDISKTVWTGCDAHNQLLQELRKMTPGYYHHSLGNVILLYFLKQYEVFCYGFDSFALQGHYWDTNHVNWVGHKNEHEAATFQYLKTHFNLKELFE